jgi:succinylglutamic semialdehyde dehydrogenase
VSVDANINLIDGVFEAGTGDPFGSIDPSTGETVWFGQEASADQVGRAVRSAVEAFRTWRRTSLDERAEVVRSFARLVDSRADQIASAISQEIGKPGWEARTEVAAVVAKLQPSLDALRSRCVESRPESEPTAVTRFLPIGAIGVIGPFNFPIHMPNVHAMPAVLAGNTVVIKPSETAPLASTLLAQCWLESSVPNGVVNLVQGRASTGEMMINNAQLNGICFTGSRDVGESIRAQVARDDKIIALEMGGNTPIIVWDSTEIEASTLVLINSCFITSGQRCSSARRLYFPTGEAGDVMLDAFVSCAGRLRVGLPQSEPEPFMGPVVSVAAARRVLAYQDGLIAAGGRALLKSTQIGDCGALLSPGVIDMTGTPERNDEEVLGPVVTVRRVKSFAEAMSAANATKFGLAAALISEDPNLFDEFRENIETGIVSWNAATTGNSARAAFGGIKASGNYRPTGFYSCDYTTRAVGGVEKAQATLPKSLPPGVQL